ncbi:MAG: 2-oxoacid:ferredoxin oxidoreductase subunit gamma [Tindallia sp. MSAO_Bac2]|nr:MAG: 2-oxoacid:ferredoxin oxidoreductase subunit gamma [Tindallia sp. MSAO_Bac2]
MMDKVIMAGFGGQGIMFLGKVLAYAGMTTDLELCWIPSYGPEMRGGTANCSVILSDEEIHSPVVDLADAVVVMNQPAYERFKSRVKPGGVLIVNSSLATTDNKREDITIIEIPASEIANNLGNASIANMVCLGALLPNMRLADWESVEKTMEKLTIKRPEFLQGNLDAIKKGIEFAN